MINIPALPIGDRDVGFPLERGYVQCAHKLAHRSDGPPIITGESNTPLLQRYFVHSHSLHCMCSKCFPFQKVQFLVVIIHSFIDNYMANLQNNLY